MERPREACGLFGVVGHEDAASLTFFGLYALQHRGQESAGICVGTKETIRCHKGMGLVAHVFDERHLRDLSGRVAIGHTRYSTTGSSVPVNAQPLVVDYSGGRVAIAHNGNLVNAGSLRARLEQDGSIFQTTTDSELILHLMARVQGKDFENRLIGALQQVRGAYSLLLLSGETVIAVRDPHGFRPLFLGRLDSGARVLASETCALDLVNAEVERELEPGEMLVLTPQGIRSCHPLGCPGCDRAFCIFEHVYFSRPDSRYGDTSVHMMRVRMGRRLAAEQPAAADVVIAVPDSGNSAAIGFSQESRIPYELGYVRNHYVGRTFLQPSQLIRNFSVRMKLNLVEDVIRGSRVVVVDDSIVRGTTTRVLVQGLREAGAREVHMRVSCPPHRWPCYYGIDFPTRQELIAGVRTSEEVRERLGVDSLGYLSLDGMIESTGLPREHFCLACYTGEYPIPPEPEFKKNGFERHQLELLDLDAGLYSRGVLSLR